ncbi:MAG: diacylglycerol kinase family protein [Ruminococcaceae bacterium]|nr:diacylglycerol kinase family protein [Oscillospiraceae bacterium]
MVYILYNPISNCGKDLEKTLDNVRERFKSEETVVENLINLVDLRAFFENLDTTDTVVLLGGDGTINVLCNKLRGYSLKNDVFLFKAGSGNDFMRDVCKADETMVKLNEYIENLPLVTINGKEYLFINNVGYGIDGKVCTAAEDLRAKGKEEINYTTLAIKLLLTSYKSNNAKVTVDSVQHNFKKVWMAPVMNGRYYGGGMMTTPDQDRNSDELSCCVVHDTNAIQTLMIFPSIFKGEHIKYEKKITVLKGKCIEVEYDVPQDVQIDGEIIRDVTKISVKKFKDAEIRDEKTSEIFA